MQKFKTLRQTLDHLEEAQLLEKLKASDPTGKWVSDFVDSDNPKFAGKSKKERIRMALGASYAAKRAEGKIKEEVELSEEMSHSELADHHATLAKKYYKKSDELENRGDSYNSDHFAEVGYHHWEAHEAHKEAAKTGNPEHSKEAHAASKLANGYDVSESVQHIDELSKSTLASYAKKASRDARIKMATGKDFERHAITSRKPEYKAGAKEWENKYKSDARKREAGVNKAIDRLAKEEVELDEEMSHSELAKYHKEKTNKHGNRAAALFTDNNPDHPDHPHYESHRDAKYAHYDAYEAHKKAAASGNPKDSAAAHAASKKANSIKTSEPTNEEVELDEGITKDTGWKPAPKERKDQYGNPIKTQNVPKRLARQGMPKQPMKEESEDRPGIHKVSVTINDKDKDDRDTKTEKMLKVKANNQAAALKIAKSHYGNKGYKVHTASYHGIHEEGKLSSGAKDPCWKGYEMVGTKKKNGREVPNCVPKK